MKMKYKDGTEAKNGDLISWNVYDFDDYTTWVLFGIYKKTNETVVYMGGGLDFGLGIGKIHDAAQVIQEAEQNDEDERGITKIGVAMDVVRHLRKMGQ